MKINNLIYIVKFHQKAFGILINLLLIEKMVSKVVKFVIDVIILIFAVKKLWKVIIKHRNPFPIQISSLNFEVFLNVSYNLFSHRIDRLEKETSHSLNLLDTRIFCYQSHNFTQQSIAMLRINNSCRLTCWLLYAWVQSVDNHDAKPNVMTTRAEFEHSWQLPCCE